MFTFSCRNEWENGHLDILVFIIEADRKNSVGNDCCCGQQKGVAAVRDVQAINMRNGCKCLVYLTRKGRFRKDIKIFSGFYVLCKKDHPYFLQKLVLYQTELYQKSYSTWNRFSYRGKKNSND